MLLGSQDVYFQPCGAFTGENSLDMLKDFGCRFVLNCHSSRRHVLTETSELIGSLEMAFVKFLNLLTDRHAAQNQSRRAFAQAAQG